VLWYIAFYLRGDAAKFWKLYFHCATGGLTTCLSSIFSCGKWKCCQAR
jgi:hypothetical protein